MLLEVTSTGIAVAIFVQASTTLRTNADAITDLDVANGLGANANGGTDDFVPDTTGVIGRAPVRTLACRISQSYFDNSPPSAKRMKVRTAYTTVGDLDIDIGFLPRLGLKLLPDHFALGSLGAKAHPALKLVIG